MMDFYYLSVSKHVSMIMKYEEIRKFENEIVLIFNNFYHIVVYFYLA